MTNLIYPNDCYYPIYELFNADLGYGLREYQFNVNVRLQYDNPENDDCKDYYIDLDADLDLFDHIRETEVNIEDISIEMLHNIICDKIDHDSVVDFILDRDSN